MFVDVWLNFLQEFYCSFNVFVNIVIVYFGSICAFVVCKHTSVLIVKCRSVLVSLVSGLNSKLTRR